MRRRRRRRSRCRRRAASVRVGAWSRGLTLRCRVAPDGRSSIESHVWTVRCPLAPPLPPPPSGREQTARRAYMRVGRKCSWTSHFLHVAQKIVQSTRPAPARSAACSLGCTAARRARRPARRRFAFLSAAAQSDSQSTQTINKRHEAARAHARGRLASTFITTGPEGVRRLRSSRRPRSAHIATLPAHACVLGARRRAAPARRSTRAPTRGGPACACALARVRRAAAPCARRRP